MSVIIGYICEKKFFFYVSEEEPHLVCVALLFLSWSLVLHTSSSTPPSLCKQKNTAFINSLLKMFHRGYIDKYMLKIGGLIGFDNIQSNSFGRHFIQCDLQMRQVQQMLHNHISIARPFRKLREELLMEWKRL